MPSSSSVAASAPQKATIYSLFLEDDIVKPDPEASNGNTNAHSQSPSLDCPCVEIRKNTRKISANFLKLHSDKNITARGPEIFRRAMASLRLVPVPDGVCTSLGHSSQPNAKGRALKDVYISPVLEAFRLDAFRGRAETFHIWCDDEMEVSQSGTSSATIWYSPTIVDASARREALLHVLFVHPGSVCWEDVADPFQFLCDKNMWLLHFAQTAQSCRNAKYVLVTDEQHAIIFTAFDSRRIQNHISVFCTYVRLGAISPLRCLLGATIEKAIPNFKFTQHINHGIPRLRGALNSFVTHCHSPHHKRIANTEFTPMATDQPDECGGGISEGEGYATVCNAGISIVAVNPEPLHFRDFDLYSMQRSKSCLSVFLRWKAEAEKHALLRPVRQLDLLTVHVDAFINRHPTLKFNLPLDKPPQESIDLLTENSRPRDGIVDLILALARQSGSLRFHVEDVIRSGADKFSQVVSGRLEWTAADSAVIRSPSKLCLKIFDETLFPIRVDSIDDEFTRPTWYRLENINFADDMIRNEHIAYERLHYLQGSLLAHCYGYHEFVLPDGRAVYGIVMEMLEGHPLSTLPWFHEWPKNALRTLIRRLRHAVRALVYAGIVQQDWHFGQIVVTPKSRDKGVLMDDDFVISFVDFAFSFQRLGEANTPRADVPLIVQALPDTDMLDFVLAEAGVDIKEEWFPRDDKEY